MAAENCGAGGSASCESDCADGREFDGGDEIVQGRLRGLPWRSEQCRRARNRKLSLSRSSGVCSASSAQAGLSIVLDHQRKGAIFGDVQVGRGIWQRRLREGHLGRKNLDGGDV